MLKQNSILFFPLFLISSLCFSADHVILISVDGLRPDIIQQLGRDELPNFYRMQDEGAWTNNARSDFDYTRTLPNHASMMTSRGVVGARGHGQVSNDMPPAEMTLHNNTGEEAYVSSMFDIAEDQGLSKALYVSKDKFVLFDQSYGEILDKYFYLDTDRKAQALINQFVEDMQVNPFHLSFIHLVDTDSAGHGDNWTTPAYLDAVKRVDGYLGQVISLVEGSDQLRDNTDIIVTADHGGTGRAHGDAADPLNYTVPFYVWGIDVAHGADLYELNHSARKNPEQKAPDYLATLQPIRNGDAGNLAMSLMGLPAIPGSTINANQDLKVER